MRVHLTIMNEKKKKKIKRTVQTGWLSLNGPVDVELFRPMTRFVLKEKKKIWRPLWAKIEKKNTE